MAANRNCIKHEKRGQLHLTAGGRFGAVVVGSHKRSVSIDETFKLLTKIVDAVPPGFKVILTTGVHGYNGIGFREEDVDDLADEDIFKIENGMVANINAVLGEDTIILRDMRNAEHREKVKADLMSKKNVVVFGECYAGARVWRHEMESQGVALLNCLLEICEFGEGSRNEAMMELRSANFRKRTPDLLKKQAIDLLNEMDRA